MTREHMLRYLTALTASSVRNIDRPFAQQEEQPALRVFLDVLPERYPGEPVFERVGRPADPRRLAAFLPTVDLQKTTGQPAAFANALRWHAAQKPLVHAPPEPPRTLPRPPSAQALRCLASIARLARGEALSPDERQALERELAEVIDAWKEDVHPCTEDGRCPDCGSGYLLELDASLHLGSCTGHPALARFEAARDAAVLVGRGGDLATAPFALPPEPSTAYGDAWEARQALELLLEPKAAARAPYRWTPERGVALLTLVAREWAHFIDRASDPCPWCRAVVPLEQFRDHLRACAQHPAERAAQDLRARAAVPVGLERLVLARRANRHELELLSRATETFDANMGWTGETGYSKKYSETPWRAAVARAKEFLGLPHPAPRCPRDSGSPVRPAMKRLLSKAPLAPGLAREAIATLRAAAQQLEEWVARLGFATTCPACARRGLPTADLAAHLEVCPLHPAVRQARGAAALRLLREGVAVPSLSLGEYDPEDYRERLGDHLRRRREATLAKLYEFEASELWGEEPRDLLHFVQDWEELQLVASTTPCPWCGKADRSAHHLMTCAQHPALSTPATAPRDALEALALRLQLEADQCAVRLARLHEACAAFWNGMREGEDGKSLSHPRIEEMWAPAREEARALLAALSASP